MSLESKVQVLPQQDRISPSDHMKNAVEQIVLLAARPELQSTASIFDEINRHQAEIKAKEAELVKAQNDLKAREGKTEDAVEMMFTANEKLKVRLRGIEKENGSLLKTLEDRDKDLNERAEQISGLESDLKNLQASHTQEIKKAAQLCRDISSPQENIKEKEKIIDKMKAAGSNLKTLLSDEQKKSAQLENERRLLQAEGQKTLEQLRKLESFVVRDSEADEDLMMDEFSNLWDYATSEVAQILTQNLSVETLNSRIQTVVRNVSNHLFDMLSEAQFSEFRQSIEKVAKRAVDAWRPIQHASKKYEPDFEPLKWDDNDWSLFQFPGDNDDQTEVANSHQGRNLLTIFPRISWVNNDKRHPQTFAIQLMGSQKQCLVAEQERDRQTPSPKINRTASKGSRRASIAQGAARPNGEHFLG
ncbi:hypothetical protein AtubIFM55763_011642 [Aspergillus tubingensis]|nr:hypothetical protein AtubIFM55763_011642 [Aspergillus tubingensis]